MSLKWIKLFSGAVLSIILISGCGTANNQEPPANEAGEAPSGETDVDTAEAEAAYQQGTCASCHGGNLEGNVGPSLEKVGSKYDKDEIVDIINNGIGQMPPQGDNLDEDAKQTLAAWLADHK